MAFLNPLLLLGVLAVVGPLVLHLLLRDRARRYVLPTLRFLPQSAPQSMAKHRIKNLLLLLARLAILVLIALAFARPYLKDPDAAKKADMADEGALFALDASLSMRAGGGGDGTDGGRWEEAVNQVNALARSMPGGSHVALMLFDRTPRVVCGETADRLALETALREAKPGMGGTDINVGIRAACEAAAKMAAHRRRVYLLSDFQDSGFNELAPALDLPLEVELIPLRSGDKKLTNTAITAVAETTDFTAVDVATTAAQRRTVRVQTALFGEGEIKGKLEIVDGNRRLASKEIQLTDDQPRVTDFEVAVKHSDLALLTVRLTTGLGHDDALAEDNTAHLVLRAQRALPLLVAGRSGQVNLEATSAARRGASQAPADMNPYLKAAIQSFGPVVAPRWIAPTDFNETLVEQCPVALAEQNTALGTQDVDSMLRYVRAGGVLIYFPAVAGRADFENISGLKIDGMEELDATQGRYRLVSSSAPRAGLILPGETGNALLGYPKAYRYFKVPEAPAQGIRSLLQFDDGRAFLLERKLGRGAIYLFTVPLEPRCCDLVLRAAFAPFMFQMIQHASHYTEPKTEFTVGDIGMAINDAADRDGVPAKNRIVIDPKGQTVAAGQPLAQAGIYKLRESSVERLAVVRLDEKESDLRQMDPTRVSQLRRAGEEGGGNGGLAPAEILAEPEANADAAGRFWSRLLLAALFLMIAESLLACRTCR